MPIDLTGTLAQLRQGRSDARTLLSTSLERAQQGVNAHTFVRRFDTQARAAAQAADLLRAAGAPPTPLDGLAISIKDLFDVAGHPSTAGSRVLEAAPAATQDCPAVARLRQAGAALLGHTNMSEFAFSGVGINPHHGTPLNPATLALDGQARIPGGSSSGAAVSVASGACWAALGSDTGGSIRIPAALQGLVGFKSSAGLVPMAGAIPLSSSLDTACAITLSVRDARLLHRLLSGQDPTPTPPRRPLTHARLALVQNFMLEDLDKTVAQAFERSLERLRAAGAEIVPLTLAELQDLPPPQHRGALVAAEAWAWHGELIQRHEARYDPRVAQRIRAGASLGAADYLGAQARRQRFIATVSAQLQGFDAAISPTVPVVAPLLQPLLDSDERFFATNALLLRNPSVVNAMDGCAISLPCHTAGELPVGLMLWSQHGHDEALLDLADQIEPLLAKEH